MRNPITIAIDAMGGENSPDKTLAGELSPPIASTAITTVFVINKNYSLGSKTCLPL